MLRKILAVTLLSSTLAGMVAAAEPTAHAAQDVTYSVSGLGLSAVLNDLHEKSGVEFVLADDPTGDVITTEIHADGWQHVVRRVLADYNYVATTGTHGALHMVRISSRVPEKQLNGPGVIATAGLQ
jgi:type II secretory pathway component GspD/PulD (secretin)